MNKLSFLLALLTSLTCLPSLQAAQHEEQKNAYSELEDQMSAMNKAWRTVRRQVSNADKNPSTLKALTILKQAATKSLGLTPSLAAEKTGAEKDAFLAGYQKKIKETLAMIEELESALKANENEKAEEIVAQINQARKKGHNQYKPKDD